MAKQKGKSTKRSSPTYFTSVITISLVLLLIGGLATFILQSKYLADSFKENVELQLEIKDNLTEMDILQYQNRLESVSYIKSVQYISKEAAAVLMQEELGDNFIDLLGFNPLFSSLNVRLHAPYANTDSLTWIKEEITLSGNVKEIYYNETLLDAINSNIQKISLVLLAISALLFFIATVLIDSTIRLAMYSNRFLIRSMQLVGATRWFIIRPFIQRGILNGFISGVIACLLLIWGIYYLETTFIDFSIFNEWMYLAMIVGGVICLGILISGFSTWRAVRKYLSMKLDDLY